MSSAAKPLEKWTVKGVIAYIQQSLGPVSTREVGASILVCLVVGFEFHFSRAGYSLRCCS